MKRSGSAIDLVIGSTDRLTGSSACEAFVATARQNGLPRRPRGSLDVSQPNPVRHVGERRNSVRFPMDREVRYRLLDQKRKVRETGNGKTINISSSGVLFTSERARQLGERLELAISWPVRLDNKHPLTLVVRGQVVRSEPGRLAVRIQQHEFHIQSSARAAL